MEFVGCIVRDDTLAGQPYLKYTSYIDVPFYQRQWFCWTTFFLVPPVAAAVVITGDVYYMRKGDLRTFSAVTRALLGVVACFWTYNLLRASFSL